MGAVLAFWPVVDGCGARELTTLVRGEWGGGRVLLLPNGFVVKPLQQDFLVGRRALIGRVRGTVVLERPDGTTFDMTNPGALRPGDLWVGPKTTGLECAIQPDGSLICSWYHPTQWGRTQVSERLRGADQSLAACFRSARPGDSAGRVRVTANGHIITNRQQADGSWLTYYVGWINPGSWTDWQHWIER